MKKRICSLLICLLFILTALPMIASAETIGQVSVAGVEAPLPGQTPTYYARTRTTGYEVYEYNSAVYRNGVCWYDEGAKKEMTPSDTFAQGGIYTVKVYLYALEGNSFKVEGKDPAVAALYNDKEAKIVNATPKGIQDPANILLLTYTFAAANTVKVQEVSFTVEQPTAGKRPSLTPSTDRYGYSCDSAEWFDVTTQTLLGAEESFLGGHRYLVTLQVKADPGYEFLLESQTNQTTVTGAVNGETAVVMNSTVHPDPKQWVEVGYTFDPCPVINVDLLAVADVKEPVGGESPAYGFSIAGEGYYSHVNDGDIVWYNDQTGQPMADGDKFEEDALYTVEINLYVHQGYILAEQPAGSVNGKPASVTRGNEEKAVLRAQFTAGASSVISAVNVQLRGEPVLGETPRYDAGIDSGAPYEADLSMDDGKTILNGVQWIDGVGTPVRSDEPFVGGVRYQVHVFLKAKEGYSFATDVTYQFIVTATVDGQPADDLYGDPTENTMGVTREFTPLPPTYINQASVYILPPLADQMPDYEPWSDTNGVEIRTFSVPHGLEGVQWYDLTDEAWMEPTDFFRIAHAYRVFITVQAAPGYRFVNDGDRPLLSGSVNDLPCGVDAALDPDRIAVLVRDFTLGVWGDVDGDGQVTSTDARLTLQYAVDKIGESDLNLSTADVDGDGRVTSTDARLILQKAVNKILYFPVEAKG